MGKLAAFTNLERALTLIGLSPLALMGCAVHEHPELARDLPPPSYRVAVPVPAPPAARPPEAPRALAAQVEALSRNFDGRVGISVRSVNEGWSTSANGDLRLPQQSVSKLWVAMTVLEFADKGRLNLDDRIVLTKDDLTVFHQPIAALVQNGPYETNVRELLRRALTMSDNTCNDRLLRYVGGPDAVRAFIQRNGLGAIGFGPGEKLLQAGTAGLTWRDEYSTGNAFTQARARLPDDVRREAFERYIAHPPDGAAPDAIAFALARLKQGTLLSGTSSAWLLATMSESRTGRSRLRGAVPPGWSFGHKTGTGQDFGRRTAGYNDVGILTAPDGRSYAVAVMIGDTPRPIPERQDLMQAVVAAIVANHDSAARTS